MRDRKASADRGCGERWGAVKKVTGKVGRGPTTGAGGHRKEFQFCFFSAVKSKAEGLGR